MTVDLTALETAGTIASALLTLMVLSYILGDNVLFRIAVHLFVGVAAGYAGALALRTVLYPRLVLPLLSDGFSAITAAFVVSWALALLLGLKAWPSTAWLGSLPMALLVGVGAALRSPLSIAVSFVGRVFIALTFGVMYAGALAAALAVLSERIQFLVGLARGLLGG